jgi:hypothetical protein
MDLHNRQSIAKQFPWILVFGNRPPEVERNDSPVKLLRHHGLTQRVTGGNLLATSPPTRVHPR